MMTDDERALARRLESVYARELRPGYYVGVIPMLWGKWRLWRGTEYGYDDVF